MRKYSKVDKDLWDSFLPLAKNSTFLFQRDFMDYHSDRFVDHSLLIYKDEKLIALLPANILEGELHSHQGLTYGGLVLGKKTTFDDTLQIFKTLLSFLKKEGIEVLNLKLLPKIYHQLPSDEIDYLLFLTQATLTRRDITSCIENETRLKIKSSNRLRGIKKAIKNNLLIKEEANFKPFWEEVLEPNLERAHGQKPVHSIDEIVSLHSNFPENIKQFNVYYNNEVVAGATIFETSKVAHSQYISANDIGRQNGGIREQKLMKAYFIGKKPLAGEVLYTIFIKSKLKIINF